MGLAVRRRLSILLGLCVALDCARAFALPDTTQFFEFRPSTKRVCYIPREGLATRQNIVVGKVLKDGRVKVLGNLVDRLKKLRKLRLQRGLRVKRERTLLLSCINAPPPEEQPPLLPDVRCAGLPTIASAKGNPDFKMQVESVTKDKEDLIVTSSGAKYVISGGKLEMWRRIDPRTNMIDPRKVAELIFGENIGAVGFCGRDSNFTRLVSDRAVFDFYADSFFVITALSENTYTHFNLILDAVWNKGSGLDRMWTDGYGGSLHAKMLGTPIVSGSDTSHSTFVLKAGDSVGHMAFPPRSFDFEGLYGKSARPFVDFIYSQQELVNLMTPPTVNAYIQDGFGVLMLWSFLYDSGGDYPTVSSHPDIRPYPIHSYKIKPELEAPFRNLVEFAHARGFKVITYLSYPSGPRWNYPSGHPLAGQHQDTETTLSWMRKFQAEYKLDGWYFDNADAGDLVADYNFIREVRSAVGPEGIIYHHDSVDVWGHYSGARAVMVNAYANYTLTGETGPGAAIADPFDPYLRFFTAGYGISQTYAAHKRTSLMRAAISEEELARALAQNLHGCQRNRTDTWISHFKPFYDLKKAAFLAGNMPLDVQWPPDQAAAWFKRPQDVELEFLSGTSVRVKWTTDLPTDSAVAYTSNGVWWISDNGPDGPDGLKGSDPLVTQHAVSLSYLKGNTAYQFKIRSSNQAAPVDEIVLGQMGAFQSGSADSDADMLIDDWELEYFGNLSRRFTSDIDSDGLFEFQEQAIGTSPLSADSDGDGVSEAIELEGGFDPLDWNNPPQSCNNDGICQNGSSGETVQNCPNDCKSGLLAHYSFNQARAWDSSRFGHDGVLHGVTWSDNAFYFPRSIAGYIQLPAALSELENYNDSLGTSTITAWVKLNATDRFNLLASAVGGVGFVSIGSPQHPGTVKAMVRGSNNTNDWPTSSGVIPPNVWSHVAFVLRGGIGSQIYINGKLDSEILDPGVILYQYDSNPNLGKGDSTSHFNGSMDEVSIWQRPLSAAEVCGLAGRVWSGSQCN